MRKGLRNVHFLGHSWGGWQAVGYGLTNAEVRPSLILYSTVAEPHEFTCTGNSRHWSRLADMHKIKVPVLIMVGQHDKQAPASGVDMKLHLEKPEFAKFPTSSRSPYDDDPALYCQVLRDFFDLNSHRPR